MMQLAKLSLSLIKLNLYKIYIKNKFIAYQSKILAYLVCRTSTVYSLTYFLVQCMVALSSMILASVFFENWNLKFSLDR